MVSPPVDGNFLKAIDKKAASQISSLFDAPAPAASGAPSGLGGLFDAPVTPAVSPRPKPTATAKPAAKKAPTRTSIPAAGASLGGLFDLPDMPAVKVPGIKSPEPEPAKAKEHGQQGILPRKEQMMGRSEGNVAELLHRLGLQDHVMKGDSFEATVKNGPWKDLVIERHKEGNGHKLYLTHYHDHPSGDRFLDSEMTYHVHPSGHLSLHETAVHNPLRGGEHRTHATVPGSKSFAHMFSRNLLDQGFGKGTIESEDIPGMASNPEFENLHPRGQGGKFTNKPGGEEEPSPAVTVPPTEEAQAPQEMPPFEMKPQDGGAAALNHAAQTLGLDFDAEPEPAKPAPSAPAQPVAQNAPAPQPSSTPAAESTVESQPAPSAEISPSQAQRVQKHFALANALVGKLNLWEPMDWRTLTNLADRHFGGTEVSGAYNARDMYDSLEVAVNRFIREQFPHLFEMDGQEALQSLHSVMELLPTQTSRTADQVAYQQFSTPPTEAYTAVKALGDIRGLRVLEPSAGTGSLASMMKLAGAREVVCNEHPGAGADVRAGLLEGQGFKVTRFDALRLDAHLRNDQFDAVCMNPPFSSTAGATKNNKTEYGGSHVKSACRLLKPGGRCVAIVGGGMGENTHTHADWFVGMRRVFEYKANLLIDGDEYGKYGTNFDNRILVFDRPGAEGKSDTFDDKRLVTDTPISLEDALRHLEGLGGNKQYGNSESEGVSNGAPSTVGSANTSGTVGGGSPAGDSAGGLFGLGDQPVTPAVRPGNGSVGRDSGSSDQLGGGMAGLENNPATGLAGGAPPVAGAGSDTGGASTEPSTPLPSRSSGGRLPVATPSNPAPALDPARVQVRAKGQAADESLEDRTFTGYTPDFSVGSPHPGVLVETGSMAGVASPLSRMSPEDIAKHVHIPEEFLSQDRPGGPVLSDPQMESVVLANVRHSQTIEGGATKGFYVGDGTGVGKGREIAGIIFNNHMQGHKRAVWFTATFDLVSAARRDLGAVSGWATAPGGRVKEQPNIDCFALNKYSANAKKKKKVNGEDVFEDNPLPDSGVMICTYDTLSRPGRLEQIHAWLNGGEEGSVPIMIFDESHKAANAVPDEKGKGSQRGEAVVRIQDHNPKARVTYLSATGADRVSNMGYMSRLGLWGRGTNFDNFTQFSSFVNGAGIAGMEMVARETKAMGAYTSRAIAFRHPDGTPLTFSEEVAPVNDDMHDMYEKAADIWGTVMRKLEDESKEGTYTRKEATRFRTGYWGGHQRFFKGLINSFKTPHLIETVERTLAENKKVVIALDSTNEGAMAGKAAEAIKNDEELDSIDFSNKDALIGLIHTFWPTQLHTPQFNPLTNKDDEMVPVWDAVTHDGRTVQYVGASVPTGQNAQFASATPVEDPEKAAHKQELIDLANEIRIPGNMLDNLILHFGHNNIAEISGRKKRLIRDSDGKMQIVSRGKGDASSDTVNDSEMARFNNTDKCNIAIISRAGAQGISLHASQDYQDQRQRVQIAAELGWQTKDEVQKLGRTHRTGQVTGPEYLLLSCAVAGDKRFSSALATRIGAMGALQKGDRSSAGAGELAKYDFNSPMGEAAARKTIASIDNNTLEKKMGLDRKELARMDVTDLLKNLFNRLLVLPISQQNEYYELFDDHFRTAVDAARDAGELDAVRDIDALDLKHVKTEQVAKDKDSGAGTYLHHFEATFPNRRLHFDDLIEKLRSKHSQGSGFLYRNSKGRLAHVTGPIKRTKASGATVEERLVHYPNGQQEWKTDKDLQSWSRVKNIDTYYGRALLHEEQKPVWDEEVDKVPATRTEPLHVLSGLIFPHYHKLQGDKKVVRVTPEGQDRIVGLQLDRSEISNTLKNLGVQETDHASPEGLYNSAMTNLARGERIDLLPTPQGSFSIKQGFHRGAPALEVFPSDGSSLSGAELNYLRRFGIVEGSKGGFTKVAYIPNHPTDGPDALARFLADHPVKTLPASLEEAAKAKPKPSNMKEGDGLLMAQDAIRAAMEIGKAKPEPDMIGVPWGDDLSVSVADLEGMESLDGVEIRSGDPTTVLRKGVSLRLTGPITDTPASTLPVVPAEMLTRGIVPEEVLRNFLLSSE